MNILTIDIGGTFIKYACMLEDMTDGFVLIFGTMIGGGFIKDHRLHSDEFRLFRHICFWLFPCFFRCSDDFFNRNYGTD